MIYNKIKFDAFDLNKLLSHLFKRHVTYKYFFKIVVQWHKFYFCPINLSILMIKPSSLDSKANFQNRFSEPDLYTSLIKTNSRYVVWWQFIAITGLRLASFNKIDEVVLLELIKVRPKSVDSIKLKGGKKSWQPLYTERLLKLAEFMLKSFEKRLIPANYSKRQIQNIFSAESKKQNNHRPLMYGNGVHSFRNRIALIYRNQPEIAKIVLGHDKINTTNKYIKTPVNFSDIFKKYNSL